MSGETVSDIAELRPCPTALPCPFCGFSIVDLDDGELEGLTVKCVTCLATGPVAKAQGHTEEELDGDGLEFEAIELWNKRPEGIERLRAEHAWLVGMAAPEDLRTMRQELAKEGGG